ncbi:class III extradiol ring-cleavage dioxygenase [Bacillus sp. REN3]|uniref:dioxygenase family protein n=1 Tax=Bacillus sp. REN3 TaxID=2802440 RepID=UPI001AEE6CA0|nr:class III extradiol ring-cleavage dioxygenase [Bacillus sp. REN3]
MQSLFICHGAPSLAIENNQYTQFLQEAGKKIGRPKAIILFTAHWESAELSMTYTDDKYETIHDFGGFQKELFDLAYPARGSRKMADMVAEAFKAEGIQVRKDEHRGLDHGAWVILLHLVPDAGIPVIQLSINPSKTAEHHYKVGEALRRLEKENILIIGSGGTVHNLRMIEWGREDTADWAIEFDDWLLEKVIERKTEELIDYERRAPYALRAIPRNEHFLPLFVAMGSGRKKPVVHHRSYAYGTLSQICIEF